ncbi:histidine kinase [Paenibacillus sp. JX-17]|uniref:Histidine kinase n=1 Tax=Paenibacillus lacisoli TaxID=3064525 RepID=A0ABT9CLH0_9BACL|nr:histidine kinase [Paenibacillus sp. JX-17]MDO7908772.1 histidine kinase [Paenibacillus sp. JX-17]
MKMIRKYLSFMNDMPIRYKFLFIYLLCVLIPILSINALFYAQINRNAEAREQENLQISVDRAGYDFIQMVNECVAIGNNVAADRTLYELLDNEYSDFDSYYDNYDSYLRDRLRQYSNLHSYILWLGVYTTNPTIQSGNSYFQLRDSDKSSEWYRKMLNTNKKMILTSYLDTNPKNPQQQMVYVSIIRKLDNYPGLTQYSKFLRIDLRLDSLQDLFEREQDYLAFKFLDEQNRVVLETGRPYYAYGNGLLHNNQDPLTDKSDRGAAGKIVRPLGTPEYAQGWHLEGTPQRKAKSTEMNGILRLILIVALITTIIPTIFMVVIFRSYNLRMRLLYKHMKQVKDEQFEPIRMYEGKDEIGGLIRSFNRMSEKIKNLINDVYKLEIQKKDLELEQVRAELSFLQSQVDPHFLFNTLNAILVICKKHKYEQVIDIIRNLAQILRRLLSQREDLVTIREEITFTEMYLQIEKFRFQDRFAYELNIDPEVAEFKIPKMSIQALVENSCKHGLQWRKGARMISVDVFVKEGLLTVIVQDNGIGIPQDKMTEIEHHLQSEKPGKHVGLRNVYKRLKLYYAGQADLQIQSEEHVLTSITITIPTIMIQEEWRGNCV